jgi:hypothetical protein
MTLMNRPAEVQAVPHPQLAAAWVRGSTATGGEDSVGMVRFVNLASHRQPSCQLGNPSAEAAAGSRPR